MRSLHSASLCHTTHCRSPVYACPQTGLEIRAVRGVGRCRRRIARCRRRHVGVHRFLGVRVVDHPRRHHHDHRQRHAAPGRRDPRLARVDRRAAVVDTSGTPVGEVDAVELVTIGQRRGLGLPGGGEKRYVVEVDLSDSTARRWWSAAMPIPSGGWRPVRASCRTTSTTAVCSAAASPCARDADSRFGPHGANAVAERNPIGTFDPMRR